MTIYMKVLKAIRIYCKTKIKFAFTTNHFVYPVHPGNLYRFFLPYSVQWCTPSNLMDLLGIGTVGPLDFFTLTAAFKEGGLPRLLTPAFTARSKDSAILILKFFSKSQLFFSFPVEKRSRRYRSHDWTTTISKK